MQVALYDPASKYDYHAIWSRNFKAADPEDRTIYPIKGQSTSGVLEDIRAGARSGKVGSTIIFVCGHGGTSGSEYGFADIAPGKRFRLGRNWTDGPGSVDVFYDVDFGHYKEGSELAHDRAIEAEVDSFNTAEGKQAVKDKFKANPTLIESYKREQIAYKQKSSSVHLSRWLNYKNVGYVFQQNGVDLVIFLTCNMGNSEAFVKKVSNDWGSRSAHTGNTSGSEAE